MKIKLTNDFHSTEAYVRKAELSKQTVYRVRRALCGISDCKCGGNLGERGGQSVEIIPHEDGTVSLRRLP